MARASATVYSLAAGILDAETVDTPLHASDGAMFSNDGNTRLWVKNSGAGTHVVTIVTTKSVGGLAVADAAFSILAGDYAVLGPFPPDIYNQKSGDDKGKVYVDSDNTESEVTILPFRG
jgi:hypothetical protein